MNTKTLNKWFYFGLLNLAIVALLGVLMRYKIAFNFPYLQQKNLLHAHSHFAFSGWISQILFAGLLLIIFPYLNKAKYKKYHWLMSLNLVASYGMLIFFTLQGYKLISIIFSTLSIFVAVAFAIAYIKDLKILPAQHPSKSWSTWGLLLNILSSAGPFFLAYMMITKDMNSNFYLGSVYYYLHFQYSGWFFFASIAIAINYLPQNTPSIKKYFNYFAIVSLPTFFLSILWAKLPQWIFIVTIIATIIQLIVWFIMAFKIWNFIKENNKLHPIKWINYFFYIAAFAISLKFILQTISIVPSLSQLVFGIRPIVIAYLHLVLLGVYSVFALGFLFAKGIVIPTKAIKISAFSFLFGVFLNELFLGLQGVAAFKYIPIPYINELLFLAAVILLSSAICLTVVNYLQKDKSIS